MSFSTIDLTLQEVTKVTEEPGETSSLGAKMAAGFSASLEGLVDGFQGMLIWISYHVFGLVVLAVIAAAMAAAGVRGLLRKKRKNRGATARLLKKPTTSMTATPLTQARISPFTRFHSRRSIIR